MLNQVTPHLWLSLTAKARQALASTLGISKSSHPEVVQDATGSHLISDGHTAQDLLTGITLEKMQKHLNSDTLDFYDLFERCAVAADPDCFPNRVLSVEEPREEKSEEVATAPVVAPVEEAKTDEKPADVSHETSKPPCFNCSKKDVKVASVVCTDGMDLCAECDKKWQELKENKA